MLFIIILFLVLVIGIFYYITNKNEEKNILKYRTNDDITIIKAVFKLLNEYPTLWDSDFSELICKEYNITLTRNTDGKFIIQNPEIKLTKDEREELTKQCDIVKESLRDKNAKRRIETEKLNRSKLLNKIAKDL